MEHKTAIMGSKDAWPQDQIPKIMPMPNGSKKPKATPEQRRYAQINMLSLTKMMLNDPSYNDQTRAEFLKNHPKLKPDLLALEAKRGNPQVQANIARWDKKPVTSAEEWIQKEENYKSGDYDLYPQNKDEERYAKQAQDAALKQFGIAEQARKARQDAQAKIQNDALREDHQKILDISAKMAVDERMQKFGMTEELARIDIKRATGNLPDLMLKFESAAKQKKFPFISEYEQQLMNEPDALQHIIPGSAIDRYIRDMRALRNRVPVTREIPASSLPKTREHHFPAQLTQPTPPTPARPTPVPFFKGLAQGIKNFFN